MDLTALKVRVYRLLPRWLQRRAVRFSTPNFTVGAIGLITVDGSQVLLVRQTYRSGWVPPGGLLGRGEQPIEALVREVREELGLELSFGPWHRVAFDARRQGVGFVSVAVVPEGTVVFPRSPEIREVGWFRVDDLPPMPNDFYEGMPPEDLDALRLAGAEATGPRSGGGS
ncbi:MAG: hydrolase [Frankiales bacterium]|nr:hydrolase [Frankiales bacterium]